MKIATMPPVKTPENSPMPTPALSPARSCLANCVTARPPFMILAIIARRKPMTSQTIRVRDLIDRMKPSVRSPGINKRISRPGYRPWEEQGEDVINRTVEERCRARETAGKARIEELEAIIAEKNRQIEEWKKYRGPSDPQP